MVTWGVGLDQDRNTLSISSLPGARAGRKAGIVECFKLWVEKVVTSPRSHLLSGLTSIT